VAQRKCIESTWDTTRVEEVVEEVIGATQHAATIGSVVAATIGIVAAKDLRLHRMGASMASSLGLAPKHAPKQVDRFLSKSKIDLEEAQRSFASYVPADHQEVLVAMNWSEIDGDDESTLCIYMLSTHGRALPLLWRTVVKSELKGQRTGHELELVRALAALVPQHVRIVLTADRGFG
jgi:hypothetical protein